MKIEEQVLTREQVRHLTDLGFEIKEPSHWWCAQSHDSRGNEIKKRRWFVSLDTSAQNCGFSKWEFIPTLTLQELLYMLPFSFYADGLRYTYELANPYNKRNVIRYINMSGEVLHEVFTFHGLFEAAFEMLCWLAEHGYLNNK